MEKHHQHFTTDFVFNDAQDWQSLEKSDFERLFNLEVPDEALTIISNRDLAYRSLTHEERDIHILRILKILEEPLVISGPKRLEAWEKGWEQNLRDYIVSNYDESALLPYYYRRGRCVMRLWNDYILPRDPLFESYFLSILQILIAHAYFRHVPAIYELGCGPGHNLLAFGRIVPGKAYHGLDWASPVLEILNLADTQAVKADLTNRFQGHSIDLFDPDPEPKFMRGAAVFTFGSMEQLGINFKPLFKYLIAQPGSIYVHIEPFSEFRQKDILLDELADRYAKKRNYLNGFLKYLENQHEIGTLEIIEKRKIIGGPFYDTWCLVVWRHRTP